MIRRHHAPSCYLIAAFAFFAVSVVARPAAAAPITYPFAGVLGHCIDIPGNCVDSWDGAVFGGSFTLDLSNPNVITAFSLHFISGQDGWSWFPPTYPDPNPTDIYVPTFFVGSSSSGTFLQFIFIESVNAAEGESDIVILDFSSPLSAFNGSTFTGGEVHRVFAGPSLENPFVSGQAEAVPEPSTLLLLATGLGAIRSRKKMHLLNKPARLASTRWSPG